MTKAAKEKGWRGQDGKRNSGDGAVGGSGRGRGRGGGRQGGGGGQGGRSLAWDLPRGWPPNNPPDVPLPGSWGKGTQSGTATDHRHPIIREFMKDHLARVGKLRFGDLMAEGGFATTDLPWIATPKGNAVCWEHVLDRCRFSDDRCKWHHPSRGELTDGFCHEVKRVITPALERSAGKDRQGGAFRGPPTHEGRGRGRGGGGQR